MEKKYPIGDEAKLAILKRHYFNYYRPSFPSDERTTEVVNQALCIKEETEAIFKAMDEYAATPQGAVKFDSHWMIGRSDERFKELTHKGWDWRSFYNGWIEGRADAVEDLIKREQATPQGIGWVKASERLPKSRNQLFLKIGGTKSIGAYLPKKELFVDDYDDFHPIDQVEWLDEGQPLPGD